MILKLEREVTNPHVSIVGLAGAATPLEVDEILTVMGYGNTNRNRKKQRKMQVDDDFWVDDGFGWDDRVDDVYYGTTLRYHDELGSTFKYTRVLRAFFGTFTLDADDTQIFPDELKFTDVPYVDTNVCVDLYAPVFVSPEYNVCAGDTTDGGVDSCQGDSGGPLVKHDEDMQVGIVSFGIGCGRRHKPGVYAKISSEIEWIKEQVCNHALNPPDWACDGGTSVSSEKTKL